MVESKSARQTGKLDSLQVLRGIAATAVVLHHALRILTAHQAGSIDIPAGAYAPTDALVQLLAIGVDIFFILSGFLMIHISGPYVSGRKGAGDFLLHRFVRIWPLYAFATALMCVSPVIDSLKSGHLDYDLQPIRLASFLFIPSFDRTGTIFQPILGLGWTLAYEVFFYLSFAAAIAVRRQNIFPIVSAIVVAAFALGRALPEGSALHIFFGKDILLEFLFGATCAVLIRTRQPGFRSGLVAAGAGCAALVGVALADTTDLPRSIAYGIPALLLFYAALALNGWMTFPGVLRLVGDASYSIYLIHYFFLQRVSFPLFRMVASHLTVDGSIIATATLATLAGVGGGVMTYFVVERPLTRLFGTIFLPRGRNPSPVEARQPPHRPIAAPAAETIS